MFPSHIHRCLCGTVLPSSHHSLPLQATMTPSRKQQRKMKWGSGKTKVKIARNSDSLLNEMGVSLKKMVFWLQRSYLCGRFMIYG